MKRAPLLVLVCLVLPWAAPPRPAWADDAATTLCRTNPAYSADVMRSVLTAQLEKDHDPSLDAETPDQLAAEAAEQGVKDCATELRGNEPLFEVLVPLRGADLAVGWDAYNTNCADHAATKPACVKAEVGAVHALKHMMATNTPPGAKILVETCELALKTDPAMADWRECVDMGLAVHAKPQTAEHCKVSVPWHSAKTGAEAGGALVACLKK
jgi:hypothetical protein